MLFTYTIQHSLMLQMTLYHTKCYTHSHTVSDAPDFQSCVVSLEGQDGSELTSPCQPDTNLTTVYTNIVPHLLVGQWDVVYVSPTPIDLPVRPAYVDDFRVGVAISEIQTTLYRAASKRLTIIDCYIINLSFCLTINFNNV